MKILVLSNLYPPDVLGGYELGCRQVVDALRARGHEVLVLTSIPRFPVDSPPHVRRELGLVDIFHTYTYQHNAPITSLLAQTRSATIDANNVHVLNRVIEEFQPDVAYVWMILGLGGLGLLATLQHLEIPWVWHLMDEVPLMLCRLAGQPIPELVAEVDRQKKGTFLSCSRQLVDEIEAGGINLAGSVEIIPNWVAGDRGPLTRSSFYKAGQPGPLRIVSAGQICQHKGIDLLIEAAARLRAGGYENFKVDLYGNASDPYFPSLVRYFGLDNHVRFQGTRPQAELVGLYSEYDLFAFPTWAREPFAFAPMEAGRQGCVTLMSQLCGNAEWFVHGVHCLKLERSAEAFARAIASIMEGEVELEPMARRQAAVLQRDFHLDAQIPRIESALDRAARRPRTNPGTPHEAYRLALLGEKLSTVLVQEAFALGGS